MSVLCLLREQSHTAIQSESQEKQPLVSIRGEGVGAEVPSASAPAGLPPAVSSDATLLATFMVTAVIESVPVKAAKLPALSCVTQESADDIVTCLSLPTGLQVHNMGFDVSIGIDPLLGVDVHAEETCGHDGP